MRYRIAPDGCYHLEKKVKSTEISGLLRERLVGCDHNRGLSLSSI